MMKVIEKKPLHEEIANNLRELIMSGELQEGDKIKEDELCSSMGISKTPLREALRVLSVEGLIKLVPNRGSFVSTPTFEEIREMFDVMSVLEGICARAAAEKMSAKDLAALEKLHGKLEKNFKRRAQREYIRINNQFHSFVQELAGNRTLNQIVNGLRQKILLYRYQSLNLPERFEQSIQEHRDLIEAFRKKDSKKTETLMRRHLKTLCDALEKLAE
ncbi:MAG: GntR family transcriptional regulator [Desulfobacterales bacterium]|nr:GntR family transcriptional regulator [Desulfobacterales bacterium]